MAERKVYLSRKTSFPLFCPDAGDSWLQLLNLVLRIGSETRGADGRRAEALSVMVTVGLPVIAEDLEVEVAKPEDFPSVFELSREDFERHYHARSSSGDAPPGARFDEIDGALFASFVLGAIDVYADWPLEVLSLLRQHAEEADRRGLEPGAATIVIQSARLHERDWERAEKRLAEHFRRPLPLQVDHSGVFLFGNDGGKARAMLLDHEARTIFWEDAFETTEELSWYIVDAMPWLLPQHIRYVGQECSTLKRAIQEGACYDQG